MDCETQLSYLEKSNINLPQPAVTERGCVCVCVYMCVFTDREKDGRTEVQKYRQTER